MARPSETRSPFLNLLRNAWSYWNGGLPIKTNPGKTHSGGKPVMTLIKRKKR